MRGVRVLCGLGMLPILLMACGGNPPASASRISAADLKARCVLKCEGNPPFDLSATQGIKVFNRYQEIPLCDQSVAEGELYRLILSPSFERSVVIRLKLQEGLSEISWKLLENQMTVADAYSLPPKKLLKSGTGVVTAVEWQRFQELLRSASFWSLPTCKQSEVLDGTLFLFEGVNPMQYHIVTRVSPDRTDPLMKLYRLILELARRREPLLPPFIK